MAIISLQVLDIGIKIYCADSYIHDLLISNFGALQGQNLYPSVETDIDYAVKRVGDDFFNVTRSNESLIEGADIYDLIYCLEKDITVEIQKIRKDLFFIHGAAVEYKGRAFIIVAPSGSGKSTTTWALLHHGFRYLSDELSPIDLSAMRVFAYPHALCLKSDPPEPYKLPQNVIRTAATIHVPVEYLPATVCNTPVPLIAIFFLQYNPDISEPLIHVISAAEASARIYANALNPLAHPEGGIDAGISIARECERFSVTSANLLKTANLIKTTLDNISG